MLRKVIDERLQMQEAVRLKVTLTPKEIENGIASIEAQNGMAKGTFLKTVQNQGLNPEVLRLQMISDLTWLRVSNLLLLPNIHVTDEEIKEQLAIIKGRRGKPEYLLSEIFLAVDDPSKEEQVRTLGERLIDQLHQGAPFPMLAGQFSQAPSAANGGSMGWLSSDAIDEDLAKVLTILETGHISELTHQDDGYHIYGLADRRIAGAGSAEDDKVIVAQMMLPIPPPGSGAPPKDVLASRAAQITQSAQSCEAFEEIGRKIGAAKMGRIGPIKIPELPPAIRSILIKLPTNHVARPLDAGDSIQVLMMCSRESATEAPMPPPEQIRHIIEDERMEIQVRRYLRDLRRAAFIDVRM